MLLTDGYFVRREVQADSNQDLTGALGVLWDWYCPFEKIEVYGVGVVVVDDVGALTTAPVAGFYRTALDGTKALLRDSALVTLVANQLALSSSFVDLDLGLTKDFPIRGEVDYPEMFRGERLTFELDTQGAGGTQNVRPFLIYREKEADTK